MDPDANWQEQKRIRARRVNGQYADPADKDRLRELRAALRDWLRGGGFPPKK